VPFPFFWAKGRERLVVRSWRRCCAMAAHRQEHRGARDARVRFAGTLVGGAAARGGGVVGVCSIVVSRLVVPATIVERARGVRRPLG